jgi:phage terminase large subunit
MTDVNIDPAVFNEIYIPHLKNMRRTQIFFGGAGSGKSVFIAQRAVIDVMKGGRNYLIARQVARTINRSVFNEIVKVITDFNVQSLFAVNKSDFTITCSNGYQILFIGLDDPEKH